MDNELIERRRFELDKFVEKSFSVIVDFVDRLGINNPMRLFKAYIIVTLFSISSFCYGQNLVPNGDFEIVTSCILSFGDIDHAVDWTSPSGGSPDYFNSCSNNSNLVVPSNYWGIQLANSGNAYAGMLLYQESIPENREYISVQLSDTLEADSSYRFKMYVNRCDKSQYSTDDIQIYLSDTTLAGQIGYNVIPKPFQLSYTGPIFDSLSWSLFEGTYTANGTEAYITIGNFKNDSLTNIVSVNNGPQSNAFVYVDNISLNKISSTFSSLTVTSCETYTIPSGNETHSISGVYMDTIPNYLGADSIITINLTITSINTSVTEAGAILSADEAGATYQWLDCSDMTPISGAISQSFTATVNGDYAVIVSSNGCSDTSTCYTVKVVGIIESDFSNELIIYPNPTNGNFSIDLGDNYPTTLITLTDLNGKVIQSKLYSNEQLLNLKIKESAGVYLLVVESGDKKAIIRLIKE